MGTMGSAAMAMGEHLDFVGNLGESAKTVLNKVYVVKSMAEWHSHDSHTRSSGHFYTGR